MPSQKKSRLQFPQERSVLLVLACALVVLVGILLFQENKQTPQLIEPTIVEQPKE